ncbi:PREDICTED: protein PHLOEM PROTEIN 2-LIKE A6-like [Camelina sativa]|uniref:Protein PHLOEM PROTEIN 2-LIKE A6-like n=1 Tax=Camelina sativa TaxID=90675 RepID=A0ABM0Y2I5_CAMSA|nr:PREDICTED: protein PHLOEM PROTEIN 2-LIKE A6-like [Camelina sativa]
MDGKVQPPQHQVFINFRGEELRNSFISHLVDALQRNGINTFTDKQESTGENISNLFERIKDSKIALAVFSERYTESRWCLDELVKISERADLGELKAIPIFYKVPTESVKQLVGVFGDHFRRREWEYRYEQERIDRWKEAVACVSGKIGMVFDDKSLSESDFIGNIVKKVLISLEEITKNSHVDKHLERGETSLNKNSKKSLKDQKGNLGSQPKPNEIISFNASNSLAPQYISSGHSQTPVQGSRITIQFTQAASPANALGLCVPLVQGPHIGVAQPSHATGFSGTRPLYDGFPVRHGNHKIGGKGDPSTMTKNTKNPNKSSKSNLEYDGFPMRYGNHETGGRGETYSMTNNNTKKPNKSSRSNLQFTGTNGWA